VAIILQVDEPRLIDLHLKINKKAIAELLQFTNLTNSCYYLSTGFDIAYASSHTAYFFCDSDHTAVQ